jgi:hypothetical protein
MSSVRHREGQPPVRHVDCVDGSEDYGKDGVFPDAAID